MSTLTQKIMDGSPLTDEEIARLKEIVHMFVKRITAGEKTVKGRCSPRRREGIMNKQQMKQQGEALIALSEGRAVQYQYLKWDSNTWSEWLDYYDGSSNEAAAVDSDKHRWRVKPTAVPPPIPKKKRLMTIAELPVNAWFKVYGEHSTANLWSWELITVRGFGFFKTGDNNTFYLNDDTIVGKEDWHWSTDCVTAHSFIVDDDVDMDKEAS